MGNQADFTPTPEVLERLDRALGKDGYKLVQDHRDLEVVIGVETHEQNPRKLCYALWPSASQDEVLNGWSAIAVIVERSTGRPDEKSAAPDSACVEYYKRRLSLIEKVARESIAKASAFGGEVRLARRIVAICEGKL